MSVTIDYYLAPASPWTYLGHRRFSRILNDRGAQVRLVPVDLGGKIFPATGGLPVGQRSAQRQAYRLLELKRFSQHLKIPLNIKPKFFPVDADLAAKLIIAIQAKEGPNVAMQLLETILTSVWAEEQNIADPQQLGTLLLKLGVHDNIKELTCHEWVQEEYDQNTNEAIELGVFGSPSYVLRGEIFWGQDRLDFLDMSLADGILNKIDKGTI
jgi:2-hydroxychromene-2-carboxylate isomerase